MPRVPRDALQSVTTSAASAAQSSATSRMINGYTIREERVINHGNSDNDEDGEDEEECPSPFLEVIERSLSLDVQTVRKYLSDGIKRMRTVLQDRNHAFFSDAHRIYGYMSENVAVRKSLASTTVAPTINNVIDTYESVVLNRRDLFSTPRDGDLAELSLISFAMSASETHCVRFIVIRNARLVKIGDVHSQKRHIKEVALHLYRRIDHEHEKWWSLFTFRPVANTTAMSVLTNRCLSAEDSTARERRLQALITVSNALVNHVSDMKNCYDTSESDSDDGEIDPNEPAAYRADRLMCEQREQEDSERTETDESDSESEEEEEEEEEEEKVDGNEETEKKSHPHTKWQSINSSFENSDVATEILSSGYDSHKRKIVTSAFSDSTQSTINKRVRENNGHMRKVDVVPSDDWSLSTICQMAENGTEPMLDDTKMASQVTSRWKKLSRLIHFPVATREQLAIRNELVSQLTMTRHRSMDATPISVHTHVSRTTDHGLSRATFSSFRDESADISCAMISDGELFEPMAQAAREREHAFKVISTIEAVFTSSRLDMSTTTLSRTSSSNSAASFSAYGMGFPFPDNASSRAESCSTVGSDTRSCFGKLNIQIRANETNQHEQNEPFSPGCMSHSLQATTNADHIRNASEADSLFADSCMGSASLGHEGTSDEMTVDTNEANTFDATTTTIDEATADAEMKDIAETMTTTATTTTTTTTIEEGMVTQANEIAVTTDAPIEGRPKNAVPSTDRIFVKDTDRLTSNTRASSLEVVTTNEPVTMTTSNGTHAMKSVSTTISASTTAEDVSVSASVSATVADDTVVDGASFADAVTTVTIPPQATIVNTGVDANGVSPSAPNDIVHVSEGAAAEQKVSALFNDHRLKTESFIVTSMSSSSSSTTVTVVKTDDAVKNEYMHPIQLWQQLDINAPRVFKQDHIKPAADPPSDESIDPSIALLVERNLFLYKHIELQQLRQRIHLLEECFFLLSATDTKDILDPEKAKKLSQMRLLPSEWNPKPIVTYGIGLHSDEQCPGLASIATCSRMIDKCCIQCQFRNTLHLKVVHYNKWPSYEFKMAYFNLIKKAHEDEKHGRQVSELLLVTRGLEWINALCVVVNQYKSIRNLGADDPIYKGGPPVSYVLPELSQRFYEIQEGLSTVSRLSQSFPSLATSVSSEATQHFEPGSNGLDHAVYLYHRLQATLCAFTTNSVGQSSWSLLIKSVTPD